MGALCVKFLLGLTGLSYGTERSSAWGSLYFCEVSTRINGPNACGHGMSFRFFRRIRLGFNYVLELNMSFNPMNGKSGENTGGWFHFGFLTFVTFSIICSTYFFFRKRDQKLLSSYILLP